MQPRAVLEGLGALTRTRTPLRDLPPTTGPAAPWTTVAIDAVAHAARALTPDAPIEWHAYAVAGSRVDVWCARASSSGRVRLAVACAGEESSETIDGVPREWARLTVRLPPAARGEVRIALSLDQAIPGSSVWIGDPMLSHRRSAVAIGRTALGAVGMLGAGGVLQRAAAAAAERDEAERYRVWRAAQVRPAEPRRTEGPLVSIVTPVFNSDPFWLRACIGSVLGQTYERWQLILSDDGSTDEGTRAVLDAIADPRIRIVRSHINRGIARASNAALAVATGTFVALLDHDDELAPAALARVVQRFETHPSADVVYTDEDIIDASGVHGLPHFKPDWSPELLTSCMYASHLLVVRRTLIDTLGGFREGYDGAQDYDLLLRASETASAIEHVPEVLYSWRATPLSAASTQLAKPWAADAGRRALSDAVTRRRQHGSVERTGAAGHFNVRYRPATSARVSAILIGPVAGDEASPLLAALRRHPRVSEAFDARGDNGAGERIATLARRAAEAFVLLIDPRLRPVTGDWLTTLIGLASLDSIGAAGATLLAEDGTIDSAGIVLGAGPLAACAFNGSASWTRGHRANALDVRNCSAVSASCLLTRRQAIETVDGFDALIDPPLLEIDYGLRLEAGGLRVAVTPQARLRGPASCGRYTQVPAGQVERIRERWGTRLDRDPYYNPNFDRRAAHFTLPDPGSAP